MSDKNTNDARQQAQDRNLREGEQISANIEGRNCTVTINPTSDPKYPSGSEYVSVKDTESGRKTDATMVVDKDGNILNENPRSSWYEGDKKK